MNMDVSHVLGSYGIASCDRARRSSHTTRITAPLKYSVNDTPGGIRAAATAAVAATRAAQASSVGTILTAKKRSLARRQLSLAILWRKRSTGLRLGRV